MIFNGLPSFMKLAKEAGEPDDITKLWLMKQTILQINLPAPKHMPWPILDVPSPNLVHQAYCFCSSHERLLRQRTVFKYALTVEDVASRFKPTPPLTSKDSTEISRAFQTIYECLLLRWPNVLQVDPGHEFMGEVTRETAKHGVRIRRGNVNIHRDQGIIEQFNRTLGEHLFTFQYSPEMNFTYGKRSTDEWGGFLKVFHLWIVKQPGWLKRNLSTRSKARTMTYSMSITMQRLLLLHMLLK